MRKNSILIIDDQLTDITVLKNFLEQEYSIYSADNGRDGIIAAEKYMPDIILLDILMLDMDGYAVIANLKSSEKTKNIPVIFITSLNCDKDHAKGLSLGAADYITKPFHPAVVKLRIRNQIRLLEHMHSIEELSMFDQLTNLPNRRNFEERINTEWGKALRENTPISILMIDLDFFKNYNDTYGHLQGDAALKSAANVFALALKRPCDFAARWGGEEFAIILPCTDSDGAQDIAEKIHRRIEETEVPYYGVQQNLKTEDSENGSAPAVPPLVTKISVSIGVNTWKQGYRCTLDEFISGADTALYNAKKNGRNMICYFGEKE